MEYEELADLVHEYNATVINNRLEYDEYRGKSRDDLKNAYQNLADSMYQASDDLLDSVNEDDPGYGRVAAQAALSRVQAEQNQIWRTRRMRTGRLRSWSMSGKRQLWCSRLKPR